jgi:hypothetical protein
MRRERAGESVGGEVDGVERGHRANARGERAKERVEVESEDRQGGEVSDGGRDGVVEAVVGEEERLETDK